MMSTASLCLMAPGVSRSRGITCPSRVVTLVRTPVKFSSKSVMKWPVSWARKSYRQSAVACSRGSNEIDSRTVELNSLREELAESSAKAGAALRSCQRLREKLQKLGQAAEEAEGDVAASEPPLAQRAVVEETLKKRMERARVYLDLTEALKKAVSVRETELIALLASAGKIGPGAGGGDVGQSRDRGGTDGAKSRAADIKPWTSEREISDLFLDLERDLVRSMMTAPQPAPKSAGGAGAPGPSPTRQGQASREGSGDARKPGSVGPSQGGTPRDKLLAALEETEQLMVAVSAKLATYEGKARESLASGGGGIAGRGAEVADGSNQGEVEDLDAILARVQKARATMTDLQATRARLLEQLATTATDGAKPGTLASGSTQRPDASNGASVRTEGTDKAPGQGTGRDRGSAGGGARQGPEEGSRGGTVWEDVPSGSSKVGGASGEDAVDPMDTVARRREFIRRMEDQGESGINSPTAAAEAASLTRELLAKRLRGKEVTLGDIIGLCDRCDDLAVATVTLSDQLDAPWLYQRALKLSLAALDVETAGSLPDSYRGCMRLLGRLYGLLSRYLPRASADDIREKTAAATLYASCKEFAVSARREEWPRAEADLRRIIFALCLLPAGSVRTVMQSGGGAEILAPHVLLVEDIVKGEPGLASLCLASEGESVEPAEGDSALDRLRMFLGE